ncbi:Divalent-cation tolerance protein CutA [Streptomyces sp. RB5]|uniref:Divalent-cation tolerance protein CutA n=1 Tax=Streptomyces smaragdinus TaxID=2585196 RepID=A0A7K0CDF2_9ACTN|nr:divalent-cation tolerance protein CutA [Streptomyces smaragdinus]MQY11498.1 Divalent-cation tolerance protein CutA [Streptomyces smaragdinus]
MADYVQVQTATQTREQAVELARTAVAERLAAGAQIIGPVASVFWHNGEFGTGEEWQLLLKTRIERYADLERHLQAAHPWQNPEVVAVPILAGARTYLGWIDSTLTSTDDQ